MTDPCDRMVDFISDLVDDELQDDAARQHIAACPTCEHHQAHLEAWRMRLQTNAESPVPADFAVRAAARVRATRRPRLIWGALGLGALCGVSGVGAFDQQLSFLSNPQGQSFSAAYWDQLHQLGHWLPHVHGDEVGVPVWWPILIAATALWLFDLRRARHALVAMAGVVIAGALALGAAMVQGLRMEVMTDPALWAFATLAVACAAGGLIVGRRVRWIGLALALLLLGAGLSREGRLGAFIHPIDTFDQAMNRAMQAGPVTDDDVARVMRGLDPPEWVRQRKYALASGALMMPFEFAQIFIGGGFLLGAFTAWMLMGLNGERYLKRPVGLVLGFLLVLWTVRAVTGCGDLLRPPLAEQCPAEPDIPRQVTLLSGPCPAVAYPLPGRLDSVMQLPQYPHLLKQSGYLGSWARMVQTVRGQLEWVPQASASPGGEVAGRVLLEGRPLVGGSVRLMSGTGPEIQRLLAVEVVLARAAVWEEPNGNPGNVPLARTDGDGRFVIRHVDAGDYTLALLLPRAVRAAKPPGPLHVTAESHLDLGTVEVGY